MNMGSSSSSTSSSVVDNNSTSGFMGNGGIGMALSTTTSSAEELAVVKVDYDMPSDAYGDWAAPPDLAHPPNASVFTTWND